MALSAANRMVVFRMYGYSEFARYVLGSQAQQLDARLQALSADAEGIVVSLIGTSSTAGTLLYYEAQIASQVSRLKARKVGSIELNPYEDRQLRFKADAVRGQLLALIGGDLVPASNPFYPGPAVGHATGGEWPSLM